MLNLKSRSKEKQLFTLLRELYPHVENEREMGALIGYSVIGGLLYFHSDSGSEEERKFEQVKSVYSNLESAIEFSQEDRAYNRLCELKGEIDPAFYHFLDDSKFELGESRLINKIFNRFHNRFLRNYIDRLQRDGIALYHKSLNDGMVLGRRNSLNHDYELIERIFAEGLR